MIVRQHSSSEQFTSNQEEELKILNNKFKRLFSPQNTIDPPDTQKRIKKEQYQTQNNDNQIFQESSSVIARQFWKYSISMDSMGSAIAKKTIRRSIQHQYPITTTKYKCKLESLMAYNYTYATHLINILNLEFPFTMAQLNPLQDFKKDEPTYHIVYRFDLFDPEYDGSSIIPFHQMGSNVGLTQISSEIPLLELLQSQYENFNFDQFVSEYQQEKKENKKNKKNPLELLKGSFENCKANINSEEKKFQLILEQKDKRFQELISIFEVNLILNMFIRSYRLEHDMEIYANEFRNYMKEKLEKYPNAIYM